MDKTKVPLSFRFAGEITPVNVCHQLIGGGDWSIENAVDEVNGPVAGLASGTAVPYAKTGGATS